MSDNTFSGFTMGFTDTLYLLAIPLFAISVTTAFHVVKWLTGQWAKIGKGKEDDECPLQDVRESGLATALSRSLRATKTRILFRTQKSGGISNVVQNV
jgi:hypothetical protein